jgi:peptide deformylase
MLADSFYGAAINCDDCQSTQPGQIMGCANEHGLDPVLRAVSEPIERIDADVQRLAEDMLATMYDAPGIGLAGIQVGIQRQIITIDVAKREADEENPEVPPNPIVLINPKILQQSEELSVYEEGCLSIPDYYAEVERPAAVTISYLDLAGKEQTMEASGILATCVQHEIDHLKGRLFVDYISKLKRDMVIRKFTKLAKQRGTTVVA